MFGAPGVSGFDVNYCLLPCAGDTAAARLVHRDSGRTLHVFTDQPGLQLYTGNHLDGIPGKLGSNYTQHSSVALETQNYPDAIHHVSSNLRHYHRRSRRRRRRRRSSSSSRSRRRSSSSSSRRRRHRSSSRSRSRCSSSSRRRRTSSSS